MMQPLRMKGIYKRSDNFKAILNQFLYSGKLPPDYVMNTLRNEVQVIYYTATLYP